MYAAERVPAARELDGAWLAGVAPEFAGATVAMAPVGTGQLADTYRLSLSWPDNDDPRPASLVCKLASQDAASRAIAAQWKLYEREVRFYRELAATARITTPHCHAAGLAQDGSFFLLMEDLGHCRPGNQLAGLGPGQAEAALVQAARLHAAFWGKAESPDLAWLDTGRIAQAFYPAETFRAVWPGFRDRYTGLLPDAQMKVCDTLAEHYDGYERPPEIERCIVHNDFRPDNMMFGAHGVFTLDWQSVALGFNALDVAYLVGGGFEPARRREVEDQLLAIYHRELTAQGVVDYSAGQLRDDYRLFSFAGIVVAVCAAMLVKRTERGDRMFLTMLDRHVSHVCDADAVALLRARSTH